MNTPQASPASSPTAASSSPQELVIDGAGSDTGNKFLTFTLGPEEYGFEILNVREIIGVVDITPLPQSPDYVRGVINLRGRIIPVMELRTRFGLDTIPYDEETCIIVLEVSDEENDEAFQMGVVVDTVNEVLDIPTGSIDPTPRFGSTLDTNFIFGLGKARDRVVTLLEVEAVLAGEIQDLTGESDEFADAA
ncbi:MAG: chemotaxis protein CheW [Phycisphaerales bacterium]